jgi:predicted NBD/HSP70 family sugar kinase
MTPALLAAGVDVGATKTHALALDEAGAVVAEVRRPTEGAGGAAVTAATAAVVRDLAAAAGTEPRRLVVVGVGIPGMVDSDAGLVRHAVNLGIDGAGVSLGAALAESLGVPVGVENDVNAAAVGAAALLGADDLVYLSIGTGIAAGAVLDGRLRRGANGAAGEIGHLVVDPEGASCACGQRGCLETVASGAAIGRRWPGVGGAPFRSLLAAASSGDAAAAEVRDEVARWLADAVAVLGLLLDPAVVAVGGGAAEAGDALLGAIRMALTDGAGRAPLLHGADLARRLVVVPPADGAGARGAAELALRRWGPTSSAPRGSSGLRP